MDAPAVLKEILGHKKGEVSSAKRARGLDELKRQANLAPAARDFASALKRKDRVNIIAEVKKASPSKGVIREDFDPAAIAGIYEASGAAAVSVLTDKRYFMGSLADLESVRRHVAGIPVLRKDFLIDPYQVFESRAAGADAVLFIVAALERGELRELLDLSRSLGMNALVETHTEEEISEALTAGAEIIGINNRDLKTFKTDISTTARLAGKIPGDRIAVSESGINTADDIRTLRAAGVNAFLVGEALMREKDIAGKLKELVGA
ncbi:MAG: indole-3-glycerol phosphate synthase TrpC [Deltaproteobacteria bacterium]|nr:indole-3-glycerol phosphate synthase TrpC [Deltaproteobacteria bacterium]